MMNERLLGMASVYMMQYTAGITDHIMSTILMLRVMRDAMYANAAATNVIVLMMNHIHRHHHVHHNCLHVPNLGKHFNILAVIKQQGCLHAVLMQISCDDIHYLRRNSEKWCNDCDLFDVGHLGWCVGCCSRCIFSPVPVVYIR